MPGNFNTPSLYVASIEAPAYSLTVNDGCGSPAALRVINLKIFPVTVPTFESQVSSGCAPLCTRFINTTPRSGNPTGGASPIRRP